MRWGWWLLPYNPYLLPPMRFWWCRGWGFGRGRGWRWRWFAPAYVYPYPFLI